MGKVRTLRDSVLYSPHDGWVCMSNNVGAVTSMEVDVLIAIHVPHMGTLTMTYPHRDWTRAGPTGWHTARNSE